MTETIHTSENFEFFKGTSASPANGLFCVRRLSDNEVSEWFDKETADSLQEHVDISNEAFDTACKYLF